MRSPSCKRKKDRPAKNDNSFHIEYGMIRNSFYIIQKIRQYRPHVLLLIGLSAVTGSLIQYLWSFIGKFVIDIVQAQALTPDKRILPLIRILGITALIELLCRLVNAVVNNRVWYQFVAIRMHMISERVVKALDMDYEMLEKPDILDMHEKALKATNSNNNGVEGMMHTLHDFGIQFMLLLVTVATVSTLDIRLILILAAIGVFQYLFFRYTVKKDRREVWQKLAPTWRKIDYVNSTTQDFGYSKDIRLFDMKDWLSGKQHEVLMEKQDKMLYSRDLWIYNSTFAHSMSMLSTALVYGILILNVVDRDMSIGNFTLYLGLCTTFSSGLTQFLNSLGTFKERSMETDDFRSFMALQTQESGDFLPIPHPQDGRYTITFQDVSYRYEGADDYALKHLNLTLEAGAKLAVVGLNGAGKTTFIKLLLRLYDPTEGRILLNGTDIRRFRRTEYYQLFAPVFQNVEVFAFPIAENVSMKKPEDTDICLSEHCLAQAGLQEKIDSLPNGARTQLLKIIEDDGVDLSGGEKQKLALARALYKNAPILVLDEPTAALDALAEYNLYKRFDEIIGSKSAVYISHRLSSTRFCDAIAMFTAGELVEYGTHEELLARGGAYAEMFAIQAQYYQDEEASVNV
ncbi:MAG: ABC transporter ATP-binding protein/permease [Ruminococcus sp.]|nr:ABC transporter ATP-binding protein/permease [Ruminococcus sp.]